MCPLVYAHTHLITDQLCSATRPRTSKSLLQDCPLGRGRCSSVRLSNNVAKPQGAASIAEQLGTPVQHEACRTASWRRYVYGCLLVSVLCCWSISVLSSHNHGQRHSGHAEKEMTIKASKHHDTSHAHTHTHTLNATSNNIGRDIFQLACSADLNPFDSLSCKQRDVCSRSMWRPRIGPQCAPCKTRSTCCVTVKSGIACASRQTPHHSSTSRPRSVVL